MESKVQNISLDELNLVRQQMQAEQGGVSQNINTQSHSQNDNSSDANLDESNNTLNNDENQINDNLNDENNYEIKNDDLDLSQNKSVDNDELINLIDDLLLDLDNNSNSNEELPVNDVANANDTAIMNDTDNNTNSRIEIENKILDNNQPSSNDNLVNEELKQSSTSDNITNNFSEYDNFSEFEINKPNFKNNESLTTENVAIVDLDKTNDNIENNNLSNDNKDQDDDELKNEIDDIIEELELDDFFSEDENKKANFNEVGDSKSQINNESNAKILEENKTAPQENKKLEDKATESKKEDIVLENKDDINNEDYISTIENSANVENLVNDEINNENEENIDSYLPVIEELNFVNVLSVQDFKSSDNLTFILGRNEYGNLIYENLKHSYNIALFSNEKSQNLLNSILISFMLKNNYSEFKFALLAGSNKSTFENYENSKYLYAGSIAKNDDEINKKLLSVISEIESRYKLMARFNIKNIDEYNVIAKNSYVQKLSNILIVLDGYDELIESDNFELIKDNLYQVLRFGRIAGIYVIVVTDKKIEEDIINFNLPTRIAFKNNSNEDSISIIGESGLEKLASDNEFLYANINQDYVEHITAPLVSNEIVKILISNIEK